MRGIHVSVMVLAVIEFFAPNLLHAATITTSTTCNFYGQPSVSDPSSCSIEQESSAPGYRGQASARSSVTYAIGGNGLSISLTQNAYIHEGSFLSQPSPDEQYGSATANGSISLEIQTDGSGTGLLNLVTPSVASIDTAGEELGGIGFTVAGISSFCDAELEFCPFSADVPFRMGSTMDVSASEDFFAYVDYANPLSSVYGTTTLQFVFTDADGNPVDISEVPEPAAIGLTIIGALLAGLLACARRRVARS